MTNAVPLPLPREATRPTQPALPARAWRFWRRRANPAVTLSLLVVVGIVLAVVLADVLAPHDPTQMNLRARLAPPFTLPGHPLGTDATGRDILSRILYGGQVSLLVSVAATLIGLVLGTVLGLLAGYRGGWIDQVVVYIVDVQLALPFLLLAVAVALVLGTSLTVLVGLAALATFPVYTRVVRGAVLALRGREFITAARSLGAADSYIMRAHLLPNLAAPLLVLATLSLGRTILLESGLSFLGIGIQPPTPSWGNMINEGREYLSTAWWLALMPGLVLAALTMAVGTLGDWLRDLMDTSIS